MRDSLTRTIVASLPQPSQWACMTSAGSGGKRDSRTLAWWHCDTGGTLPLQLCSPFSLIAVHMTRECDRANMSESKNMSCCSLAPNAGTRLLMPKPSKLCYTSNTAKIGLRTHKGYFSVNFRVLGVILHSCVIFPVLAGSINVFITAAFSALPIFSCCCRTLSTKTFYKPPMYST